MGLFDRVELYEGVHLPGYPDEWPPAHERTWQTKEIDRPEMTTFRITADGRLLEEECHSEHVPPAERPYAGRDDVSEGDLLYACGMFRRVHDGWTTRGSYHGRFRITSSDGPDTRLTYRVTFTEGRLQGFERVD